MSNFGAVEGIRDEGAAAMLQGLPKDFVDEDSLVEHNQDVVADDDAED